MTGSSTKRSTARQPPCRTSSSRYRAKALQYSYTDHVFSSNLRFRLEYLPGSELFVVYTDERETLKPGYPDLKSRAFVVKINRLFRF